MRKNSYGIYDILGKERVERLAKIIEKVTGEKLDRPIKGIGDYRSLTVIEPLVWMLAERTILSFKIKLIQDEFTSLEEHLLVKKVKSANKKFSANLNMLNYAIYFRIPLKELDEISDQEIERNIRAMLWAAREFLRELRKRELSRYGGVGLSEDSLRLLERLNGAVIGS